MSNIYDNGAKLIGDIYHVKEYMCKNCEDFEEIKDIIEELEDFEEDTIVCINYDCPMGYMIDYFRKCDLIKDNN